MIYVPFLNQDTLHAFSHEQLKDPRENKEDVEMVSFESKNQNVINATFLSLDSGVEYVISVCKIINGCIISSKSVTVKHNLEEKVAF